MISKQTAMDIALAYREVETAEALLQKITEDRSRRAAPDIRDAFGRLSDGLQLGVPSGQSGHTLYQVPWSLCRPIIETHIARQKAIIATLSEKARSEIGEDLDPVPAGYSLIPPDAPTCDCMQLWRDGKGNHWCCNKGEQP